MQNAWVNVNGEITRGSEAKVSVFDRSFMYGDSLYEVVRTYDGVFFKLEEHLDRLFESAKLCRMDLGQAREQYQREMERTVAHFRSQPGNENRDAYCRLIVSRGVGRIGFGLQCLETPTQVVVIVIPVDEFVPTREKFEKGLKLQVVSRLRNDPRALDPAMKSGNYLNNLLAYLEAASQGYDDALLCNADGHLTEGTTFNIAYVKDGIVVTPPLDIGILNGITRTHMIALAREEGVPVRETRFPKERLYEADEVFVTSSLKEVFPVSDIDGRKISGGKPGPITRKLSEAYKRSIPGARR